MKKRDTHFLARRFRYILFSILLISLVILVKEFISDDIQVSVINADYFDDTKLKDVKLGNLNKNAQAAIIYENSSQEIEAYFCAVDNCTLKFIQYIDSADKIDCALYDLSLKQIIVALNQSHHKGKDVRIIVDNENYKKVSNLEFAKQDTSSQLSHNKFCIFDLGTKNIILTGSFNPTRNAYVNDNNIVILQSKYIAQNYAEEFEELWNGVFSKGNHVKYPITILNSIKIENYFCPEDSCADHVNSILNSANNSIYFMAFSFTNDLLANTIIMKHDKGVEVKGVYEKSQTNSNIWKKYTYITKTPVTIVPDKNKYNMHHKVFIIDNKTVVTGSFNPTKSADTKNDENVIIIHDNKIAERFTREFVRIFEIANNKNENRVFV